jgi:lysophospholipase L1-like esterase
MREALNQWIRTSKAYDAVIDFDQVTRDAANPKQIRADYNIRDHLHPNDVGYQAMADAVELSLFKK